jgi:hypothetical protein
MCFYIPKERPTERWIGYGAVQRQQILRWGRHVEPVHRSPLVFEKVSAAPIYTLWT